MGLVQRLARNFGRFMGREFAPQDRAAEEIYLKLRNTGLNMTPEELHLTIEREDIPFGVLMEQDQAGRTATLMSFETGDASLYFSTGRGMIGGGVGHESIATAAKTFVQTASSVLDLMRPTTSFPRPSGDAVFFYVLTSAVVYFARAKRYDLDNPKHPLRALFEAGHGVMTEYRKLSPSED